MRKLTDGDLSKVRERFVSNDGAAWQESQVEFHPHHNEAPAFILLYDNFDFGSVRSAAAEIADWYEREFSWPALTISFQVMDDHKIFIVAFGSGPGLAKKLRNLEPFANVQGFSKKDANLFQSLRSLSRPS